ncbi:Conserved_hypothetical protein [Hexamita inflata]|uniref:Uncharacterized protein n=1 Tax=Hexamita inflata TaxID=28002 RepID=A0ABP1HM43_9EUKA
METANSIKDAFILNDRLCVQRFDYIFQYSSKKLKCLYSCRNLISYQFCDLVYVTENVTLSKLNNDFSKTKLKDIKVLSIQAHFGPIIIIQTEMQETKVFDMLSCKYSEYNKLRTQDLDSYLELGNTGLKLKDKILIQLFGEDYPKQVDDYYNAFTKAQEEKYKAKEEPPTKLEKCQLMHVFKPLPHVDLYMVIEDNSLYIVDKEMNILKQTPINCEIYARLYAGYEQIDPFVIEGHLHQIIPCEGRFYMLGNKSIYCIKDTWIKHVVTISDDIFNKRITANMYCINEEIYVQTATNTYLYRDSDLQRLSAYKYFRNNNHSESINQFLNKALSYQMIFDNNSITIFEVNSNNNTFYFQNQKQLINILGVSEQLFQSFGVLIVKQHDGKFIIADLLNGKCAELEDFDNMQLYMVLGNTGLELQSEFVRKYFGMHFEQKRQKMYNEVIQQQMQYPCYLEEIRKLGFFSFEVMLKLRQNEFKTKYQNIQNTLKTTKQKLNTYSQIAVNTVDVQISLYNRLSQSLANNYDGEILQ